MVGEAAFLRRSFSHPSSASREAKEGDPACALTESISFGRFMSESLAWEKWSTFTHNRYLEEIEQFSKPGSVAQKKAFFEAHYKKRAAMKAAALLEQATATVSNVPQTKRVDENHQDSSLEAAVPVATGGIVTDQQQENGALNTSLDHSANANASYDIARVDKSETAQEKSNKMVIEQNVEVESQIMMENVKHVENSEDCKKLATIPEEKMPEKEVAQQENVDLPSNRRQMSSSSKLTSQAKVPKLPNSSAKQAGQLKDRKSVLSSSKNSAGDLIYMKRSTQKSIHMSINFASHSGEASKSTLRMLKESATASRDPARASVHGVSKILSSVVCHSENNSHLKSSSGTGSKAKSVISSLKADESSLKSSSVSGSNVRSSVISCPFSFKSEERAAKRKEFFQKLKERNRAKAEKHILEEKEVRALNRPQLRTSFRTKFENSDQVSNSHSNHIKKMLATRPHSPERGGKPIPSIIQEKSSQLPRRPPVNTGSSKDILSKSNQSTTRSVTMLQKKKARENASPNIHR